MDLRSVPFHSVPFRSVPFRSVPFRSVPFRPFLGACCASQLGVCGASRLGVCGASRLGVCCASRLGVGPSRSRTVRAVVARSIDRIDRFGTIRYDFRFFGNVGELEICLVSKFQLCTTLGGRKNAEKPKREKSDFWSRSIRSIR